MSADDNPHIPKFDQTKPVVWTAEDASRFLTSAIHEAQKPLAEALKQRPITSRALTLIVAVLVIAALAIGLILSSQLEKTEKRAEAMLIAREEILSEKVNLQAQTTTLQDRLAAITNQHVDLKGQIDALRQNEEKHKRTQTDLFRFRRQNELLRSQISGLEMEKVALSRQLEAVKALADAEPSEEEHDVEGQDPFESSGAADDGSSPAPEQPAGAAAPVATEEPTDAGEAHSSAGVIPAALQTRADSVLNAEDALEKGESANNDAVQAETIKEDAAAIRADVADIDAQMSAQDDVTRAAGLDPAEVKAEAEQAAADAKESVARMASESPEEYKKDLERQARKIDEAEKELDARFTPDQQKEIEEHADKALADVQDIREKVEEAEAAETASVESTEAASETRVDAVQESDAGAVEEKSEDVGENLQAGETAEESEARSEPVADAAPEDAAKDVADDVTATRDDEAKAEATSEEQGETDAVAAEAEDAGERQSFPDAEEAEEAKPETAAPAAEVSVAETTGDAAAASASEYVTLDPNATVPAVNADEATGE